MQTSKKTVQQINTNKHKKKVVEYMEENNNFLSISQVIKQLDDEYTEETKDSLYNSNYIYEY